MQPRLELAELFDLIAASLTANVLPHVSDHYAKTQLRAASELLANLGQRVEWRRTVEQARADVVRSALASTALQEARSVDQAADLTALLARLGEVIDSLYSEAVPEDKREESRAAIWRVIRAHYDAEAERMRTGASS